MRNAPKALILALGAAGLAACAKQPQSQAAANQDLSIEGNLADSQIPPNAQIETLPPDESSETSSGELQKGDDNPDVNDLGNAH
jgi:hypothetical protein